MNWKRLLLAALAVLITLQVTNFIIHGAILSDYYSRPDTAVAFRSEQQMGDYMWVMYVTAIVFSFFFVFIFAKGFESRGMGEGIRYGIYIGLFYYYVNSFNQFVMYPIPYELAWIWILAGLVQSILMGIVAALIYRPKREKAVVVGG